MAVSLEVAISAIAMIADRGNGLYKALSRIGGWNARPVSQGK
jgi:hypothetical protein